MDEASFQTLCDYIRRTDKQISRRELEVLKANLVYCCNNRKKHCFDVQLQGGPPHRSMRQAELEWQRRKQVSRPTLLPLHTHLLRHCSCMPRYCKVQLGLQAQVQSGEAKTLAYSLFLWGVLQWPGQDKTSLDDTSRCNVIFPAVCTCTALLYCHNASFVWPQQQACWFFTT